MNKIVLVLVLLGVAGFAASFKIDFNSGADLSGSAGSKRDSDKSSEHGLQIGFPGAGSTHGAGLKGGSDKSSGNSLQFGIPGAGSHGAGLKGDKDQSFEQGSKIGSSGGGFYAAGLAGLKSIGEKASEYYSKIGISGAGSKSDSQQSSGQGLQHGISGAGLHGAGWNIGNDKSSGLGTKGGEQSQIDLAKGKAEVSKNFEIDRAYKLGISAQRSIKGGRGGPPPQIENYLLR